jgi:hypothetical protein
MLPDSYTPQNLRKAMRNPALIRREAHRVLGHPIERLNDRYSGLRGAQGIDVIKKDWDNLVILDACRYDAFSAQNPIDGELYPVVSRGTNSWEFMEGNFVGRQLHDTVYVTTNPYVGNLPENVFYTVDPILDRWDRETGTVLPESVADAAIEAHQAYPDKRLIIHFMQPHQPYLGPTAEQCHQRVDIRGYRPYGHAARYEGMEHDQSGMNWWTAVHRGHISRAEIRQAYSETLDITLECVRELLSELDGRAVITADHGELLGERTAPFSPRRYGHSHDTHPRELCIVPWLETSADNRRDITSETPIGFERLDDAVVNERLHALGYASE